MPSVPTSPGCTPPPPPQTALLHSWKSPTSTFLHCISLSRLINYVFELVQHLWGHLDAEPTEMPPPYIVPIPAMTLQHDSQPSSAQQNCSISAARTLQEHCKPKSISMKSHHSDKQTRALNTDICFRLEKRGHNHTRALFTLFYDIFIVTKTLADGFRWSAVYKNTL